MPTVLIVDDEAHIREVVQYALEREGFTVICAANGRQALQCAEDHHVDLVVLDILMPEMDGTEVCRRIRASSTTPIVFLSSKDEEIDRIVGLELGGDDYLTKPFSPRTLLARVKALLRRAGMEAGGPMTAGPLSLDLEGLSLRIGAASPLRLTKLEARLLQILMANAGHVVGTERLLVHVWGRRGSGDRQLLKQLVHRLRHKLEPDPAHPRWLTTEAGAGYRLDAGDDAQR